MTKEEEETHAFVLPLVLFLLEIKNKKTRSTLPPPPRNNKQAHCVAASFYDGDAALGVDPTRDPEQSVGRVCDLFGVAPRGQTVLLLEPEGGTDRGQLARSTVTFIRPQRWSELDDALED